MDVTTTLRPSIRTRRNKNLEIPNHPPIKAECDQGLNYYYYLV